VAEAFDTTAPIPVIRIDRPMADNAVLGANHIAICGAVSTAVAAVRELLLSSAREKAQPVREELAGPLSKSSNFVGATGSFVPKPLPLSVTDCP